MQEVKRDGTVTAINSYDAYGIPGASSGINNMGRFRYTGQTWIPELGMYYYKARMYSPTLGRFMQTDPIGYADGMNIYAYVGNDPVNGIDPSGLEIVVTGHRSCPKGHTCISGDELRDFLRKIRNTLPADFINGHELFSYEILVEADDEEEEPQSDEWPCGTTLQKIGDAGEVGGDALIYPGLILAGAGLAVGPEGAVPGLVIVELGGLVSTAGQVAQDINHGEAHGTIAARAVANALIGRVAGRGLRALNAGRAAPVIDDVFGQGIGEGAGAVLEWLDPQRCP